MRSSPWARRSRRRSRSGESTGDAMPQFTLAAGRRGSARQPSGHRRHVAQPGDRRGQPGRLELCQRYRDPPQPADPAENTQDVPARHARRRQHDRLEVYLTQGESSRPLDCSILGKYVFTGIHRPTPRSRSTSACRTTSTAWSRSRPSSATPATPCRWPSSRSPTTSRGWAGLRELAASRPRRADPRLPADRRFGEHGRACRSSRPRGGAGVPRPLRLHHDGGRPDLVLDQVTLQAEATDNVRRIQAALPGSSPTGTHEPDRCPRAGPRPAQPRPTGRATS